MIYRKDYTYEEAFDFVRQQRNVCRPNIGFSLQLVEWRKRWHEQLDQTKLYRVGPLNSISRHIALVPKKVEPINIEALEPRTCYILQAANVIYLWRGRKATNFIFEQTVLIITQLQNYEKAPTEYIIVEEKREPEIFWQLLGITEPSSVTYFPITKYNYDYDSADDPAELWNSIFNNVSLITEITDAHNYDAALIYNYPNLDAVELIDENILLSTLKVDGIFIIAPFEANHIYVWVGDSYTHSGRIGIEAHAREVGQLLKDVLFLSKNMAIYVIEQSKVKSDFYKSLFTTLAKKDQSY